MTPGAGYSSFDWKTFVSILTDTVTTQIFLWS